MGGHGHDHHHGPPPDPYRVPKPEEYSKIEVPELLELQRRLAKHGLKDPWIRNHVWRYDKSFGGGPRARAIGMLMTGVPTGITLFLITLGIEKAFNIDYHPWLHEHAEGHGEHGSSH